MSISKIYKLNKKDFLEFYRYMYKKPLTLLTVICFFIFYVVILVGTIELDLFALITSFIEAFVIILFYIPLIFLFLYILGCRHYNSFTLKDEENEITINEEGIFEKSETGSTNLIYNKIFRFGESKNAFYALISNYQAIIIPKRIFTDSEISMIKDIASSNIDVTKVKLLKQ